MEDFEEYNEELRLVKKLRKGQITVEEFQKRMADIDPEDLKDFNYSKKTIISSSCRHSKNK